MTYRYNGTVTIKNDDHHVTVMAIFFIHGLIIEFGPLLGPGPSLYSGLGSVEAVF